VFQTAFWASLVKSLTGFGLSDIGIPLAFISSKNLILTSSSLIPLEKGPIYDIKAEAINTSPTITSISAYMSTIIPPQRSFSEPRAFNNLVASSNLSEKNLALAIASSLSAIAPSYSA